MNGAGVLVPAALLLAAAVFLALETFGRGAQRRRAGIARVRSWVAAETRRATWRPRRSGPAVDAVARLARRLTSAAASERLAERIGTAGLAGRIGVAEFLSLRLVLVAGAVPLGLVLGGAVAGSAGAALLFALLCATAAYVLPGAYLGRRAARRADLIEQALPDALDLLAVTVEAGLGLYGAVAKLVEATEGPLAEEFAVVLAELRVGESSDGALKALAKRVGTPAIASFVRAIQQGDQLGLSLARTLRTQAEEARRRRRALAEERAAKAPVKMLVPAALFIFPALFIVILGPAVLELSSYL
jgi:tight adherence protein C